MKFRSKPNVVLAEKYVPGNQEQANRLGIFSPEVTHKPFPILQTPRGEIQIMPNDWIVTPLTGDKFVVPDHLFSSKFQEEGE